MKYIPLAVACTTLALLVPLTVAHAGTRWDTIPPDPAKPGDKGTMDKSLVANPKKEWLGIGQIATGGFLKGVSTGTLIDATHVLTCAHTFFQDAENGMGALIPNNANFTFTLPEIEPGGSGKDNIFSALTVNIYPDFMDDQKKGKGHRKVGFDIAIVTLDRPVPADKTTFYTYNTPKLIQDERDPKWTKGDGTVKIGFGKAGDGNGGSTEPSGFKRIISNAVDQFGGQNKLWATKNVNRDDPPPANTLVYDFSDPTMATSSDLTNAITGKTSAATDREGSPASGDSGGPMFMKLDGKWILVGLTSSGTDDKSRYGTVAYDTRVQSYATWISATIAAPEPPSLLLILATGLTGAPLLLRRARVRTR